MIRAIIIYVLAVCGIAIWLCTDEFSSADGYISIGLVVLPLIVLLINGVRKPRQSGNETDQPEVDSPSHELQRLMLHGRKITVNFSECEVVSNDYTEEVLQSDNHRVRAFDSLYGDGGSNISRITINQSVIVFKTMVGSKEVKYTSPVLPVDRITLLFKLDFQKQTTLYVDPSNYQRYSFDLEFLKRESQ